jgi:hypothetical protein
MSKRKNIAILKNSQRGINKQLERSKRQVLLMRIIESGGDENYTFEEIAAKMRKDNWVAARWPEYSASTAHADFTSLMVLVKDDVRELALPYFVRQLAIMDDVIETLHDFVKEKDLHHKTRIDSANSLRGYLDQQIKVFGNYAPKEMHIKKSEISVTLDDFMKAKKAVEKERESAIEGEIVDG